MTDQPPPEVLQARDDILRIAIALEERLNPIEALATLTAAVVLYADARAGDGGEAMVLRGIRRCFQALKINRGEVSDLNSSNPMRDPNVKAN